MADDEVQPPEPQPEGGLPPGSGRDDEAAGEGDLVDHALPVDDSRPSSSIDPSPPPPVRFGKSAEPGGRRPVGRHLLASAGLVLLIGCLWALFNGGLLPAWRPSWSDGSSADNGGAIAVVIDPGHGGGDSGAVAHGMVEKDLNLDVGLRVARELRAHGIAVRLTRTDDHFITLEDRVRQANALPGAIFVSIHFNDASGDGKAVERASGIETFYSETKEGVPPGWPALVNGTKHESSTADGGAWAVREGESLADAIQGSLITGTAATDRGIKERGLYVTRRVHGPAVLVEGGFVSHPAEARLLGDPAYRQKIANSIAAGILHYLVAAHHPSSPAAVALARSTRLNTAETGPV